LLFLMNDVILNIDPQETSSPLEASRLHALSLAFVVKLGQELYAEHPMLQKTHPEKAARLAILLMSKQPDLNAALFVAPAVGCEPELVATRFCSLSFDIMAVLQSRQNDGSLTAVAADREVWRRLAA
jgi:hypothetical protein